MQQDRTAAKRASLERLEAWLKPRLPVWEYWQKQPATMLMLLGGREGIVQHHITTRVVWKRDALRRDLEGTKP